jgi:opacity protein-like surface antigen
MKYCILIGVLSATCLSAQQQPWGQPGQAGRLEPRPYVRGDVGLAITDDMDTKFFPGAGSVSLDLDPGMRFSVAGGALFGGFFGLEAETGFIFNDIDNIRGFTDVDGWVSQVPFLVNAFFQYKNKTGFTPFGGAGVGGAWVGLFLDDATSPTVRLDGEDADFVFAWQAFAGVKFELNDNLSVGLIYKYLWTDDGHWDVEDTGQDIHFDGTHTHSFSAVVNYSF